MQNSSKSKESDTVEILSGVFEGKTTGTPITFIIENQDTRSRDYGELAYKARPGHADFTADEKYGGFQDFRGGGHFSGRITAGIVAAGAVAISALKEKGIYENTIIIYTSDHGCHFKTRNFEYKRSCHESSIHTPLVFGGGAIKKTDNQDCLVSLIDLPPTILNLADSDADIEVHLSDADFCSEYYRALYEGGKVVAIDLTGNFYSDDFAASVAEGLTFLARNNPPYCIHCTEGKDRAGFTAMLLEALMGATLDEIVCDYMLSFYNYYGIEKDNDPKRYQAVLDTNLLAMLCHVTGAESIEILGQMNLEAAVTEYLLDAGMLQDDILLLKEKLG